MKQILVALLLIACSSCGTYSYLPKPKALPDYVYGAQMNVRGKNGRPLVSGEFLGIKEDTAYILGRQMYKVAMSEMRSANILFAHTSDMPGGLMAWSALLPVSTLSPGLFMIYTIPLNLAVCVPVGCTASSSVYGVQYPSQISREQLAKFARFPQGMPEQLTLTDAVLP
jgi:hypothetical protein